MNKKTINIYILIMGFILSFSYIQCVYIPTYNKQEKIEDKNVLLSSPEENLPSIEWKKNWQTPDYDYGLALTLDSSENIHVAGYSGPYSDYDFLYLKYSKYGIIQDSLTHDQNTENNYWRDIIVDSSNNVFIVGYTDVDTTSSYNYNTYITKLYQWAHIWGGSGYDAARSVALDSSENVYMGGLTRSYGGGETDVLLMKYTNAGALQWNQTYGGIDSEWANSMAIDSSDNIYLGGGFEYFGTTGYDSYLIKVASNGVPQWSRRWGGIGEDLGISIAIDSQDNIYMVGYTESYNAVNSDLLLLKYDSFGNLLWNITWGTDNSESGWPIAIDQYDGIYVGGDVYDYDALEDYIFLVKYDTNGNQIWNMTQDFSGNTEGLYDIALADSGDIYLTGYEYFSGTTYYDVFLMKYNYELPEIGIISPENKTYTEPMRGYYAATYGFESDASGTVPFGWENFTYGYPGTSIEVISEFNDHKNVLEGRWEESGAWNLLNYFNNTEGTIEFWVAIPSNTIISPTIVINNGSMHGMFELRFFDGNIKIYLSEEDGGHFYTVGTYENDTWCHIRLDYRSISGTPYMDLNSSQYRIYINDVDKGVYNSTFPMDPQYIHLFGGTGYFDAFGYSWDPNYNIGDNLEEGLVIDYKSKNPLEWQGYSLDGHQNVTTLGSTVIPFQDDGPHSIQIFGNNSNGDYLQSEKRFFTVDTKFPEIMINSPSENSIFEGVPPIYNIDIIEENVISAWYTLDGGITNISLTELSDFIDFETWFVTPDGPVTLEFYVKDILGNIAYDTVSIIKEVVNPILVDLVDLTCTEEAFDFTFNITNEHDTGIDSANILILWDGLDVSSDIQNLGGGLYFISLDPILVAPGEEPILLTMTVSASGYDDTYLETKVSIDPDTVRKGSSSVEFPLGIIIIVSTVSAGALFGIIIYIYMKKRKTT